MKKLLSLIVVAAFLLFVGIWALSFSGNSQSLEVASSAVAPAALPAASNLNFVALPLDSSAQLPSMDAIGLITHAGDTTVDEARVWNAGGQLYDICTNGGGLCLETFDNGFPLSVGGAYWLAYNNTGANVLSFVGDVPNAGSVSFALTRAASCQINEISIPLDQASLEGSDAIGLITAIGAGIEWAATFDANSQVFDICTDGGGLCLETFDGGFPTRIGYPYRVCANNGAAPSWP